MVLEIETESEFVQRVAQHQGCALVDFYAQWCGPCKKFTPTFNRLSEEWKHVNFYKVDVDVQELENVVKQENIECMPTFVLYVDGEEVERCSGIDENKLVRILNQYCRLN
jgi:thioredoxin 1